MGITIETYEPEMISALKAYDKYIISLEKTPEECASSLRSLMGKAINAYESRGPNLRHGIALDREITIILSQTDGDRPLCGIYFNLFTPYQQNRKAEGKPVTTGEAKQPAGPPPTEPSS